LKKFAAAALCAAFLILLLAACAGKTPEEAEPYSAEELKTLLETAAAEGFRTGDGGQLPDFTFYFTGAENLSDEDMDADINSLMDKSAILNYYLTDISWSETRVNSGCVRLDLTYTYGGAEPYSSMVSGDTPYAAALGAIDALNAGTFIVPVYHRGAVWDIDTVGAIMDAAYSNANCPTPFDVAYYCYPCGEDGDPCADENGQGEWIYELHFDSGVEQSEYDRLARAQNSALDALAGEAKNSSGGGERALYRAAHDVIVDSVAYDDGMYDSISAADGEVSAAALGPGYTAYGAAVDGESVCNGYAMAYKQLCDRLGLDCWVVTGESEGEAHAWDLVRLDGETYLVDCTWDDATESDDYFLAAVGSEEYNEHVPDENFVFAW
jgi:hypothetical protein